MTPNDLSRIVSSELLNDLSSIHENNKESDYDRMEMMLERVSTFEWERAKRSVRRSWKSQLKLGEKKLSSPFLYNLKERRARVIRSFAR